MGCGDGGDLQAAPDTRMSGIRNSSFQSSPVQSSALCDPPYPTQPHATPLRSPPLHVTRLFDPTPPHPPNAASSDHIGVHLSRAPWSCRAYRSVLMRRRYILIHHAAKEVEREFELTHTHTHTHGLLSPPLDGEKLPFCFSPSRPTTTREPSRSSLRGSVLDHVAAERRSVSLSYPLGLRGRGRYGER